MWGHMHSVTNTRHPNRRPISPLPPLLSAHLRDAVPQLRRFPGRHHALHCQQRELGRRSSRSDHGRAMGRAPLSI
jgi:hypothetical protein